MSTPKRKKTIEDAQKFIEMVAAKQGWKVNPDKEFVKMLAEGLMVNYNRYGYYCCPCRLSNEDRETDKDIICPCIYTKDDMPEFGHCYCGLYLSEEFFESGKKTKSIPERRPDL